jgi:hypothetical protein
MSVDPMQATSAGGERQTPEKTEHPAPPPLSSAPGNAPKEEIATAQSGAASPLIPEHEFKVQLDSATDDIMVYRVLDTKSGALVFQVPSAEVLSGIHQSQELLQQIASRGNAATADEVPATAVTGEGKNHGRKL